MAASVRKRVGQTAIVALALVPVWKSIEPYFRGDPKAVSAEAARLGRELFTHRWTTHDPLTNGDGLGPVFNASSCVECHNQGGAGGGGPVDKNVTVYALPQPDLTGRIPQSGVVHLKATDASFWETLNLIDRSLPRQSTLPLSLLTGRKRPGLREVSITQRNTPALFGAALIDAIPNDDIVSGQRWQMAAGRGSALLPASNPEVHGRVARLRDGRIGRFGWKLEFATLREFVKAACANELGLSNPGRPQATPLSKPLYQAKGVDLTDEQCDLMTEFIRSLPRPIEAQPVLASEIALVETGRSLFDSIGCNTCHVEKLGPARGLYSDLLLHNMGGELASQGGYERPGDRAPRPTRDAGDDLPPSDEPSPTEWRTPPLWGVADSGPYLHDGRAGTLEEAIERHGGEARSVGDRFTDLPFQNRQAIIAFLKTLRAPAVAPATIDAKSVALR
jgi:CxxC motif-containing protein (DUF1111 family)